MNKQRHRILNRKWLFLLSVFMILRAVIMLCGIALFTIAAWNIDLTLIYAAGACLALLILLQLFHVMECHKIICPDCRSQILKSRRCAKHRNAKKLFGSYSLRIAFQVIFSNKFRCHFCDNTYQWRGKQEGKRTNGQIPAHAPAPRTIPLSPRTSKLSHTATAGRS